MISRTSGVGPLVLDSNPLSGREKDVRLLRPMFPLLLKVGLD